MPSRRSNLTLAAERRKPQVTVRQLMVARIEDGVVKYQLTLFYNVLYSGVKSLRLDVPAEVAARLRRHARPCAKVGHLAAAEGSIGRRRGLEPCRRDGIPRRRQDRTELGKEDSEARHRQER